MGPDERAAFDEVAHLRAELARSERMRRALADVIVTVGSNLGLEALLERVCSIIDEAYESFGAMVYLWDLEIERLVVWAGTDPPHRAGEAGVVSIFAPGRDRQREIGSTVSGTGFVRGRFSNLHMDNVQLRLGEGLTGWVAEHREAVVLGREPWKDPRFKPFPELHEDPASAMLVPILLPNREVLGVISLWSRRSDHFTAEHLRVLSEVTGLLATVIEKIRLDEELARRAKVLSFLGELCGRLSSPRPLEELMDSVAILTADVMASDACMIVTVDPQEGRFVVRGLAPARAEVFAEIDGRLGGFPPGR